MAFRNRIVRISQLVTDLLATGTAPSARWELSTSWANTLKGYSGLAAELAPALIQVSGVVAGSQQVAALILKAAKMVTSGTFDPPELTLNHDNLGNTFARLRSGGEVGHNSEITLLGGASGAPSIRLDDRNSGPVQVYFGSASQCYTGTETALKGTAPPVGQPKLIKQDTVVVTTGAAGEVNFDFASGAFPNGIVSFIATPGDNTANFNAFRYSVAFSSLLHVAGYAQTYAGLVVSSAIRLNYVAYGW